MPMSVVYTNFDGQIVHENRGGVERTYVSDPQGSTIALLDEDGNVTDTFDYWPYGEVSERIGTTPTPFGFVGTLGYYEDPDGSLYVRARDYRPELARWQTVDPLWPKMSAFKYAEASPVALTEPMGLWWIKFEGCTKDQIERMKDVFNHVLSGESSNPYLDCLEDCRQVAGAGKGLGSVGTCIRDHQGVVGHPPSLTIVCAKSGQFGCSASRCALGDVLKGKKIVLCPPAFIKPNLGGNCGRLRCTLAHELIHLCGSIHSGTGQPDYQCVKLVPGCEDDVVEKHGN